MNQKNNNPNAELEQVEREIVGACILRQDAALIAIEYLDPSDMLFARHSAIFEATRGVIMAGGTPDLILVRDNLLKSGKLEIAGGAGYLAQCVTDAPVIDVQLKARMAIVKNAARRRKLLRLSEEIAVGARDTETDPMSTAAATQKKLTEIDGDREVDDTGAALVQDLEKQQKEFAEKHAKGAKIIGFSTGFRVLDDIIDGIRPGHVWVVGGWTSSGKSQMALNVVHNLLEQMVPVSIISLEMGRVDIAARLIGIRHNMGTMRIIKSRSLPPHEYTNVEEGKFFLSKAPLHVHTTVFDLEKIKLRIRRDFYRFQTKFFVVDYVQNILSEKSIKEYELLTRAATDLQALARDLGVTIYIVSQISNESQKGNGAGAGFKGTGALEAVADIAIRIERDRKKEEPNWEYVPFTLRVTKNRHGFTCTVNDYYLWLKSGKISNEIPPQIRFSPTYGTHKQAN